MNYRSGTIIDLFIPVIGFCCWYRCSCTYNKTKYQLEEADSHHSIMLSKEAWKIESELSMQINFDLQVKTTLTTMEPG